MNAVLLNKLLSGALLLIVVLAGAGFYFATQFLAKTATDTDQVKTDVSLTAANIEKLKRLETEMKNKSQIVSRAKQIVSDSSQYRYQDQIVQDVNAYAKLAGVEIGGFTFVEDNPSVSAPGNRSTTVLPAGVKRTEATVTLKTPIQYDNFLRFLKAIEQNLTKMQVTGVNMIPDENDTNFISNPSIGLQIYIKQ